MRWIPDHIEVERTYVPDPLGNGGYTTITGYHWPRCAVADLYYEDLIGIDAFHFQPGDRFCFGPWHLSVVAVEPWSSYLRVTRNLRWAWWYQLRYQARDRYQLFKRRGVQTCAVWGLGSYDGTSHPRWSHITFVKRLAEAFARARAAIVRI